MNVESVRPKTKPFTRPPVKIKQHPENHHDFSRKRVVTEERLYKDTLSETESKDNSKQSNNSSYLVTIYITELNYYLKSSEEKFKCITGASSFKNSTSSSTSTCRHQRYTKKLIESRYSKADICYKNDYQQMEIFWSSKDYYFRFNFQS